MLLTGSAGQLSHVMSHPGHLVLCDRMCHEGSCWAASWVSVLSTRKIRIVRFGGGLLFEVKVFLPPARPQRQYLNFPLSERVWRKQLEVSTGNFQTFESRNYSSPGCSGDFYFSCLMGSWKESKWALCRNGWQQHGHQWGSKWDTKRGHYAASGAEGSEIALAWYQLCYWAATCFFHPSLQNKGVH